MLLYKLVCAFLSFIEGPVRKIRRSAWTPGLVAPLCAGSGHAVSDMHPSVGLALGCLAVVLAVGAMLTAAARSHE